MKLGRYIFNEEINSADRDVFTVFVGMMLKEMEARGEVPVSALGLSVAQIEYFRRQELNRLSARLEKLESQST